MYNDYDDGDWSAGLRSRETWVRGFFMLLFLFALWLVRILLVVTAVFQFCTQLIRRRPIARLLPFGRSVGLYLRQISDFLTFNTEDRPFPFSPWPDPGETAADFMDDPGPPEDAPFERYDRLSEPQEAEDAHADAENPPESEPDYGETGNDENGEAGDEPPTEEEPGDRQPPRPDA